MYRALSEGHQVETIDKGGGQTAAWLLRPRGVCREHRILGARRRRIPV